MLMNSTKTELENMVSGIGCELSAIAYGERWKLLGDDEQLTAEQTIKKVIDNEGSAEFVEIIEGLFDYVVDYDDAEGIQQIIDNILNGISVAEWDDILDILRDEGYIEKYSVWDYFSDGFDIEYRIDGRGNFQGVEVCVACGGPSIYVDDDKVWGVWGSDRAEYYLCRAARDIVYDWGAEMYSTLR
ncbi:MAG: hypothetical protein FWG55_01190 [Candidatus Bathyarchaeota archaeon]|nr:hypothetical protein [Candidatus Termiticorpusculum sp.]